MQTVAETPFFLKQADRLVSEEERKQIVDFIAFNPELGVVMPGTGGVRKIRVALPGRGKRGGARVVYYYHSERIPLYALMMFAKNETADLSQNEKKAIRALVRKLKP